MFQNKSQEHDKKKKLCHSNGLCDKLKMISLILNEMVTMFHENKNEFQFQIPKK